MSRVEVDQLTAWLWCLRTPIVQAYAIREREGFNLVDTTTAGEEDEILAALAGIAGQTARVHEVLLTHGHADHTGAAAGLRTRTGARIVASRDEAPVIAGERPAPARRGSPTGRCRCSSRSRRTCPTRRRRFPAASWIRATGSDGNTTR
jgi:glyoxylase-like metal-dependent hydrolase (beta-lactamase superfamily II)